MGIHIVIDGYNLIRQSQQFKELDRRDLQSGRDALVDALAAYKKVKGYRITVIFDGTSAPAGMSRRDTHKGISLCYSSSGETADTVIKRMAEREKEKLMVVTSDREIVRYAQAMGSTTIDAAEFEDRLTMVRYMDLKGVEEESEGRGWQPTTRKKGPSRRLTKRQRKMNRKLDKL